MRTTLALDDDLVPQLRNYAEHREISISRAASELIRKGLGAPLRTREVSGFHVVDLPPGSPTISAEHVSNLEDDLS